LNRILTAHISRSHPTLDIALR